MDTTTLFDSSYTARQQGLLDKAVDRLKGIYSAEELEALRVDPVNREILAQRSGRGFVNRDIIETLLGNLLECVAPGSHNTVEPQRQKRDLRQSIGEIADQLYAMIAQSLLAAGEVEGVEEAALTATYALLWEVPRLKERARWNRFASLKDPAVWDAYLRRKCGLELGRLMEEDFSGVLDTALRRRDVEHYRRFLGELGCPSVFDYQMQLVMSTYPGWRVLFYHDIAHTLTRCGPVEGNGGLEYIPIPLLPRAMSELGGRYYQADLHPETQIGDANFIEHPHRGITTGQTGVIGSGCRIFPCTLGGLSEKVRQRHPVIGDYVSIGTDAGLFGRVEVGDDSVVGANTEIYGLVEIGAECWIGSAAVIGTIKTGEQKPGAIRLGQGVRVGDGTVIENRSSLDLEIPAQAEIPARSHVTNDGCGKPMFVRQ